MSGLIASRTGIFFGSRPSATARTAMSRSVIIPKRRSFSRTGMAPMSSRFIFSSAFISVGSSELSSIFAVIMSRSSMVGLLGPKDPQIQILCSPRRLLSRSEEFQEFGVNNLGVRRAHTVRELRIDLQDALLQKLRREQRR